MFMSRRRFFAGLSGFAASALLGGILPGQSMARSVGSPPAKSPGSGRTHSCSVIACGGGGCNLLAASAERLKERAALFAVDRESPDTRFNSHAHIKTYAIKSAQPDALENLRHRALGLRVWPNEELVGIIDALSAAGSPVIIVSCLGGSTGSLVAIALAAACQSRNLPVQAVVTTPLHFETLRRSRVTQAALGRLVRHTDALYVLSNQMIFHRLEKPTALGATLDTSNECIAKHLDFALEFAGARFG